jgi:hypothetical protein
LAHTGCVGAGDGARPDQQSGNAADGAWQILRVLGVSTQRYDADRSARAS